MIEKLKEKYGEISYEKEHVAKQLHPDVLLLQQWAYRVPKGWYGFALSGDVPLKWAQIINEYLKSVETRCPNFEIHQIKLKFGGLRMHLNLNSDDEKTVQEIKSEIGELQRWLYNKSLVY